MSGNFSKIFVAQNLFGPKILLDTQIFCTQNLFGVGWREWGGGLGGTLMGIKPAQLHLSLGLGLAWQSKSLMICADTISIEYKNNLFISLFIQYCLVIYKKPARSVSIIFFYSAVIYLSII